jgi:hypothetical protein
MEIKSNIIRFGKARILNRLSAIGLIILISMLTFNGCKSRKRTASGAKLDKIDHTNYVQIFNLKYPDWKHYQSKVKITYNDGQNPITVNATIRMQQDSLIWLSVNFFGGIEVARVLITRDSAIMMDKVNRRAVVMNKETIASYTGGYDLDLTQLQDLILGKLILKPQEYQWFEGEPEKDFYMRGRRDSIVFTHLFGLEKIIPLALTITNISNADKVFVEYSQPVELSLFSVPGIIKITAQTENELNPVKIDLNLQSPGFTETQTYPFAIPQSYEIERH